MRYIRPLTRFERQVQEWRYQLHEFCVILADSPAFVVALFAATVSLMYFGQAWGMR